LILRKITKILATRCQILRQKCTKFGFSWGILQLSASPPDLAGFKGPSSKGREGRRRKEKGEVRARGICLLLNSGLAMPLFASDMERSV